jgi:hypothetical protein
MGFESIPKKAKKFGLKQVQFIRREMDGNVRSMINQAVNQPSCYRVAAWVRTGNIRRGA